jgi:ribosomal protein S18 acetylase RimI-like enzyme
MTIRKATLGDVELLVKLRMDFLSEEFGHTDNEKSLHSQLVPYYQEHLPKDTFIAILAEIDGQLMAAAYLVISEMPQILNYPASKIGTVYNVFTYRQYRRQGIATQVLIRLIAEAKLLGVTSVKLSATQDGVKLYEKLGFVISKHTAMTLTITR